MKISKQIHCNVKWLKTRTILMLQFKPKMTQAELIAIKVIKSQLKIIDNRIDERTILQIFELSFSIGHENDHFSNLVQNMRKGFFNQNKS